MGTDSGIEVDSTDAVAQVKAYMRLSGGATCRDLYEVTRVAGKAALHFSLSAYTPRVVAQAERARVVLPTFDLEVTPKPVGEHAEADVAG